MDRNLPVCQFFEKNIEELLISAGNVKGSVTFDLLIGTTAVHEPKDAHQPGIGRIESAHVTGGPLLGFLVLSPRKTARKKIQKRFVVLAVFVSIIGIVVIFVVHRF